MEGEWTMREFPPKPRVKICKRTREEALEVARARDETEQRRGGKTVPMVARMPPWVKRLE